jgi:hypothetical protein
MLKSILNVKNIFINKIKYFGTFQKYQGLNKCR